MQKYKYNYLDFGAARKNRPGRPRSPRKNFEADFGARVQAHAYRRKIQITFAARKIFAVRVPFKNARQKIHAARPPRHDGENVRRGKIRAAAEARGGGAGIEPGQFCV